MSARANTVLAFHLRPLLLNIHIDKTKCKMRCRLERSIHHLHTALDPVPCAPYLPPKPHFTSLPFGCACCLQHPTTPRPTSKENFVPVLPTASPPKSAMPIIKPHTSQNTSTCFFVQPLFKSAFISEKECGLSSDRKNLAYLVSTYLSRAARWK